jgi:hypothetical protein
MLIPTYISYQWYYMFPLQCTGTQLVFMKHELVIQVLLINNSIHYRCQLLQLACVYVRLLHHVMLDVR